MDHNRRMTPLLVATNTCPSRVSAGLRRMALLAAICLLSSWTVRADVLLYRGEHVYLVPRVLGDQMLQIAPGGDWRYFRDHTRRIDSNGDGLDDFIAIAIGADNGFGVQLRYRLERPGEDAVERLGTWYWAVVTDASGEPVFEAYND